MPIRRSVLVAVMCAVPILSSPQVHAEPQSDGCHQGSVMTGRFIPGTGSAGQSIWREAAVHECASSLLPGIDSGRFTATIPWSAPGTNSVAEFAWSDGSVSTATGYGNGLWLITGGPATGHGIQVNVADPWNGWYLSNADVVVTSVAFVS
ncbi:hypothetical protein ACQPW1_20015 [Nocardia sp. CA-128927]|uniref:hypothetical protein n=1 Tax=Nocardia sp. CA-128927 TaxID=3239975 RepID=UPI003D9899FD